MNFEKSLYWYQVIDVDPRNKDNHVGEIYGSSYPQTDYKIIKYDSTAGDFYTGATVISLGRSPKGLTEEQMKDWLKEKGVE